MAVPRIPAEQWNILALLGRTRRELTCGDVTARQAGRADDLAALAEHEYVTFWDVDHNQMGRVGVAVLAWQLWTVRLTSAGRAVADQIVRYSAVLQTISMRRHRGFSLATVARMVTDADGLVATTLSSPVRAAAAAMHEPGVRTVIRHDSGGTGMLGELEELGLVEALTINGEVKPLAEAFATDRFQIRVRCTAEGHRRKSTSVS